MKQLLRYSLALILTFVPVVGYAATTIPFTINLSEPVNVVTTGGTPRIALDVGGVTRYATYASGTGTSSLTFNYPTVAGDVDLDGITVSSPIQLNGGAIADLQGNPMANLSFTPPNTSTVKVNYPSLGMDFVADADGRYTLNGTAYNDLSSFLTATGGSFTRNSVGTYFDSTGTLQTAPANTPRFDHDPVTNARKGILIEEQRPNLLTRSSEFENAAWIRTNVNVIANATTAPDGTMTGDEIVCTTASNPNLQQGIGVSGNGNAYTQSAYLKAGTVSQAFMQLYVNGSGGVTHTSATIISGPGSLSGVGTTGITISGLSSTEWTRVSITGIPPYPTGSLTAYVKTRLSGTTIGDSIYVWGAQLERGSFPTSYIPTTTAAVTRAADVFTVPIGGWFNQPEGTMYSQGVSKRLSGEQEWLFTLYQDGSNFITAGRGVGEGALGGASTSTSFWVRSNATTPVYLRKTSVVTLNTPYALAAAYKLNDFGYTANGTSILRDNSGTLPSPINLYLGFTLFSSAYNLNGYISNFKYYPARISDTQLQLMTQ